MKKIRNTLATGALIGASVIVIGLSRCNRDDPYKGEGVSESSYVEKGVSESSYSYVKKGGASGKSYIEGIVINEVMVENVEELPYYPYAFAIETLERKVFSFDVNRDNALSVNAKINNGDRIRIDKKGVEYESTLKGAKYIDVLERASISSENLKNK